MHAISVIEELCSFRPDGREVVLHSNQRFSWISSSIALSLLLPASRQRTDHDRNHKGEERAVGREGEKGNKK